MLLSEVGISDTGLCWLSFSCPFARHHMGSRIWFVYFGPQPLKPLKNSDSNCWQRCQARAPVQYPNTARGTVSFFSPDDPSLQQAPVPNRQLSRGAFSRIPNLLPTSSHSQVGPSRGTYTPQA